MDQVLWNPPKAHEYYFTYPSPADHRRVIDDLLYPIFKEQDDSTFGRRIIPRSPAELALREAYNVQECVVNVNGWLVSYELWKKRDLVTPKANLVFIHGINAYAARFAPHAKLFLEAGYQIIAMDLPAHGKSSGLHAYLPDMDICYEAVIGVLNNVNSPLKTFVMGMSLGGYTAIMTCLKCQQDKKAPRIAGGIFLCPMVAISPQSRPHWLVERVANALSTFFGPLPLINSIKGHTSDDPRHDIVCGKDPNNYHGKMRIATGLAIVKALSEVSELIPDLETPFLICHGMSDRVTSYLGSVSVFERARAVDKDIKLYPGYEHMLFHSVLDDETEDLPVDSKKEVRGQVILDDILNWLDARV